MNRVQFYIAVIFAILSVLVTTAPNAFAQTPPAACQPSGTYRCQAAERTDYEYKAQLCTNAQTFPSVAEAAEHFFSEAYQSSAGCPATDWSFLRKADNEESNASGGPPDPDFTVHCAGEGSGPYPINEAGFDTVTYSLYDVTTYSAPTCDPAPAALPIGAVLWTSDVICPEGQTFGGTYPNRYCVQADADYDAAKNLGCPAKSTGQCTAGNPINIGTGNKYQAESDFAGVGPNPLRFQRYYNSHAALSDSPNGFHRFNYGNSASPVRAFLDPEQKGNAKAMAIDSIGVNWRHTYQRGVVDRSTTTIRSVALYRQDGRILNFNNYNGSWDADADVNYSVTELTSSGTTTGWEVKTPSDSTETYNASGQLISIADRAGVVVTVTYDSVGRVDKVTDQFGRELDFGYAAEPQPGVEWWEDPTLVNQITSVTDPAGNTYTYAYNTNGTLKSVTYPDTNVREYRYENASFPFALTAIIDGNLDQFATWGYDSEGRANLSYHGVGTEIVERVDITYTKTNSFAPYFSVGNASTTHGLGSAGAYTTSTGFSGRWGVSKMDNLTHGVNSEARTYDTNGNVERYTDLNGNVTYRTFNSRNLETLRREAENDPLQRDITTTWHPTYRLPDVITEPNRTIDYDYYANGDVQTVTITSLNTSGTEDLSTDGNRTRIWSYQYNAYGQVTSIDGPRVDVVDVTTLDYYDDPTCPSGDGKCGQLEYIINAEGHRTDFNEYYTDGRLKKMTDPNGLVTEYEYNSRRDITKVTLSDGTTSRVTTYIYDNAGQIDTVTFPNGLTLTYAWTTAHLLDSVVDNFGNKIEYAYDAHGNQIEENRKDLAGTIRNALATTYDDFGFVDAVTVGTTGSGNSITTDYDHDPMGNLDRIVDADAKVTDYAVDALGRAHRITDALTNDTDFGFDTQDNVDLVTAPNGATTALPHDGLGNLDNESSPDRGAIDLDYDDAGNLKIKLDARGLQTQYQYDKLNRLTLETLDGGGTISYEYDVGTNAKGRLTRITDASGETSWSYNAYGDITAKTQKIGTITLTTSYQYQADGKLASMTLPSGKVISYGYNSHLPDSVTVGTELILSGTTYEPFGPVKAWTWGNAMSHSRDYDTRGLMVGQTLLSDNRVLGYDSVGRLNSLDDGRGSSGFDYTLLVPDTGSYENSVQAFSNRLDSASVPTPKTYTYDAAGNITGDGVHTYGFDDRGRLTSVNSGTTASYQHNGQGQRVKKTAGSTTTLVYLRRGRAVAG